MTKDVTERNDIVQITSEQHHWFPCLIVVTEVRSWGIQGFAFVPRNDGSDTGSAYIRLKDGEFEKVGRAVIAPADEEA